MALPLIARRALQRRHDRLGQRLIKSAAIRTWGRDLIELSVIVLFFSVFLFWVHYLFNP